MPYVLVKSSECPHIVKKIFAQNTNAYQFLLPPSWFVFSIVKKGRRTARLKGWVWLLTLVQLFIFPSPRCSWPVDNSMTGKNSFIFHSFWFAHFTISIQVLPALVKSFSYFNAVTWLRPIFRCSLVSASLASFKKKSSLTSSKERNEKLYGQMFLLNPQTKVVSITFCYCCFCQYCRTLYYSCFRYYYNIDVST